MNYTQIGIMRQRDPVTREFIGANIPIYIKTDNINETAKTEEEIVTDIAGLFAEKYKEMKGKI